MRMRRRKQRENEELHLYVFSSTNYCHCFSQAKAIAPNATLSLSKCYIFCHPHTFLHPSDRMTFSKIWLGQPVLSVFTVSMVYYVYSPTSPSRLQQDPVLQTPLFVFMWLTSSHWNPCGWGFINFLLLFYFQCPLQCLANNILYNPI